MSDKQFKRARRRIKPIYNNWEVALKAGMKVPWYIKFAGLFWKQIKKDWIHTWEKGNQRMMRVAMKKLSHELEGER